MLLPTQEDPFTPLRDRWEGKGQSETGFYLRERLWTDVRGVISTLALPFASTTVRVRSANPFNAGVGRRRSKCGVAWANQPIVSWKGTSVPGFSTAASTNARNHAIVLLLNHPNAHPPHLMPLTVLVGRASSHRLPPLRDLSIHSPHVHSVQISSPLAPFVVRNPTWCSHPCQAKCHTGPCPPCTIEITRPCRCGGTARSLPCHQIHNSGPSDHPAEEG